VHRKPFEISIHGKNTRVNAGCEMPSTGDIPDGKLPFDNCEDVFIGQLVRKSNSLRLMLDRFAIHNGDFEIVHNGLVDGITLHEH